MCWPLDDHCDLCRRDENGVVREHGSEKELRVYDYYFLS